MKSTDKLNNKKIAFLGLGIENFALIKFLYAKNIACEITIFDFRIKDILLTKYNGLDSKKIKWILGQNRKRDLSIYDIVFRSPGWPSFDRDIVEASKKGVMATSAMQLFFESCPTNNIIGVTGTKGKGTTSSLIYEMIKKSEAKVWLGGSIGIAPFGFIDKIKKNDWVVLELSSFQLEDLSISPHISIITNLFSEHLAPADPQNPNFHKSFTDYWRAKQNILLWQKKRDKAIINIDLKNSTENLNLKADTFYFSSTNKMADCFFINDDIVLPGTQFQTCVRLPGEHNRANIVAAAMAAKLAGIDIKQINSAISHFHGLEHRLELIDTINGVQYYNDSFATIPEGTITALRSFDRPIILIAGGAEKKSNFRELAIEIQKSVRHLILLTGDATPRLAKEVKKFGFASKKINICSSMAEAVSMATKVAEPGNIVLMSPACASFGMFSNYKERGKKFKDAISSINNTL